LGYTSTAEIDSNNKSMVGNPDLYEDEYRLRLTKAPKGTVSITVTSTPTATDRKTPSTRELNRNYTERVQVEVNETETFTLLFTPDNWFDWQTVRVAAIDDIEEEGTDLLYFPSQPSFLSYIQGPIAILGAGAADVPGIGLPLLLPLEFDDPVFVPPCGATLNNGTLYVIEENQVDHLIINNQDVRGSLPTIGTLTASQLTGMNMGRNLIIGGEPQLDGIFYQDMEVIEINLGNGKDILTVENTSAAMHVLNLAGGNDEAFIKEISGPFIGTFLCKVGPTGWWSTAACCSFF
jgi:hypothetical protein